MPQKSLSREVAQALQDAQATIPYLKRITQLHVCHLGSDASGALLAGAVLLSVSVVDNDEKGDGFRYLIGLPEGVHVTPYLSNFFKADH